MSAKISPESGNAISPNQVARRFKSTLIESIREQQRVIIKLPTGAGKSYTVSTTEWRNISPVTGGQPIIHVHETRNARDEAAENSENAGLNTKVVKNRKEICPIAKGDYDDELREIDAQKVSDWIDQKCDVENIPYAVVRENLLQRVENLPGDDRGVNRQWDKLLRNQDGTPSYDIVHTTANFLHIPDLVENANIIFDEQPDYTITNTYRNIQKTANRLLREHTDTRYTWEGLLEAKHRGKTDYVAGIESLLKDGFTNDWWDFGREGNRLIEKILLAVINARVNDQDSIVGSADNLSIVINSENTIKTIRVVPDLTSARSVIGLDAHPSPLRWQLETDVEFTLKEILGKEESNSWRRNQRQLRVIQVGDNSNSLTKGWRGKTKQNAETIIRAVREKHRKEFKTCICPKSIKQDVIQMMKAEGIESPNVLHYGHLKSSNAFTGETVGLVLGRIDLGSKNVLEMAESLGLDIELLPFSERNHRRNPFTGPDSHAGQELLDSLRVGGVQQAVGRYARQARNPDDHATVYVWTNTLPKSWVDEYVDGVTKQVTEKVRRVEQIVQRRESKVTKRKIMEETGLSDVHVLDVLKWMYEDGLVTKSEGSGLHGADEYQYLGGVLKPQVDIGNH